MNSSIIFFFIYKHLILVQLLVLQTFWFLIIFNIKYCTALKWHGILFMTYFFVWLMSMLLYFRQQAQTNIYPIEKHGK